jgi:hypothetical protein
MKTDFVEIAGTKCTVFTEIRSGRLGHDSRATRQTLVTVFLAGRQIASGSNKKTAIARAKKVLAGSNPSDPA